MNNNIQNIEKKSNKKLIISIIVFILIVATCIIFTHSYIKELNNKPVDTNENNTQKNDELKEENQQNNLKLSFIKQTTINNIDGLYGAYNDGSSKLITDKVKNDKYYLDGDIVYYTDSIGNLFSTNINEINDEPKSYDFSFQGDVNFGAKNGKLYYFLLLDNGKYAAVTYNLITGEEHKVEMQVDFISLPDFKNGTIAYFNDQSNGTDSSFYYSYNFETNELKRLGQYDYLLENRENSILFEKYDSGETDDKKVCLFDKKANVEKFCINLNNFKETNTIYNNYPTTIKDDSILILANNQIKECVSSTNCEKVLYTLTPSEEKEPYKLILYYEKRLVLVIGYNEICEGGCSYSYKYYDITNNKKEINIPYHGAEYNELYFME